MLQNLAHETKANQLRRCADLITMSSSIVLRLIATENMLGGVQEIFRDSSTDFKAALPVLNGIALSAGLGEMRKHPRRFKSLTLRQLRCMSPQDEAYSVVTKWIKTLRDAHDSRTFN